jgi:hypothetical protein
MECQLKRIQAACHKNLRTTQHYAKILDKKVSDDREALRQKMHKVS